MTETDFGHRTEQKGGVCCIFVRTKETDPAIGKTRTRTRSEPTGLTSRETRGWQRSRRNRSQNDVVIHEWFMGITQTLVPSSFRPSFLYCQLSPSLYNVSGESLAWGDRNFLFRSNTVTRSHLVRRVPHMDLLRTQKTYSTGITGVTKICSSVHAPWTPPVDTIDWRK